jgi:hypothetical protein
MHYEIGRLVHLLRRSFWPQLMLILLFKVRIGLLSPAFRTVKVVDRGWPFDFKVWDHPLIIVAARIHLLNLSRMRGARPPPRSPLPAGIRTLSRITLYRSMAFTPVSVINRFVLVVNSGAMLML